MRKGMSFVVVLGVWLLVPSSASAQSIEYLLRPTKASVLERVYKAHGLTPVRSIGWLGLTVVTGPAGVAPETLEAQVRADRNVRSFERDHIAVAGESAAHKGVLQTTEPLQQALVVDRSIVNFYGVPAWAGFVRQPALAKTGVDLTQAAGHTGSGTIVAIIDTGIDPTHALLKDALLDEGYDFTRNEAGASEWKALYSSTTVVLQGTNACDPAQVVQSMAALLEQSVSALLEQSVAALREENCQPALLTQSVAALLESDEVEQLGSTGVGTSGRALLPPGFGHGTMVAGLIRGVAPHAKILPIRAFTADGTGRSSDIAQAIYYAVWRGAKVINMSFTFPVASQEVMWATVYAASKGVVLVGSAGNRGLETRAWPAEHKWVVGVGSTDLNDVRSSFSNHGFDTLKTAAPGENLITTFPGGRYASVSGTSFSAPLVSGAAALMSVAAPLLEWGACRDVVYEAPFPEIIGAARDASGRIPTRFVVPVGVELAPVYERETVKQLNHVQ